jgi:hypothetical protein
MAKKPQPPKLFWLAYRHPEGAGVVVIESHGLLHARLKASLAGADRAVEFVSGHKLDPVSADLQIVVRTSPLPVASLLRFSPSCSAFTAGQVKRQVTPEAA